MKVYFLTAGPIHRVKIGKANDVDTRIAELQIGCPFILRAIGVLDVGSEERALQIEQQIHAAFRSAHIHGEWFNLGDAERYAIHRILEHGVNSIDEALRVAVGLMNRFEDRGEREEKRKERIKRKAEERRVIRAWRAGQITIN